jgi:hypothetical protein
LLPRYDHILVQAEDRQVEKEYGIMDTAGQT